MMEFIEFIWPLMAFILKGTGILMLFWIFIETISFNEKSENHGEKN